MPLMNDITYQTVINNLKNYIKTNCRNISNWNSIPNTMRTGYVEAVRYAGNNAYNATRKITCTQGISQANGSNVDNDMNNFLGQIGLNNKLNQVIKNEEFFRLLNDFGIFCRANCCFASGMMNQNTRLLIYKASNNFSMKETIANVYDLNLIEALDVTVMLNCLESIMLTTARVFTCKYKIEVY